MICRRRGMRLRCKSHMKSLTVSFGFRTKSFSGGTMYTLLTGATGLVGRYLVRDLLLNEHNLAVVVRPSRRQSPADRIEEIMQHWERELGRPMSRPVVLSGDICEPGFGMSDRDAEWVRNNCSSLIHSAAILEFYGKDRAGEPWRTNLNGTQNMIEVCRSLGIRDIHYVSTAYVAGFREGLILEDQLSMGQTFRNDYEESKFLAEQLVRQIDFADHVTVYRPAVISGDSRTGYTNTYHGMYLYLRLMALMIPTIPPDENGNRHTPIRLQMTGEERRNIIPVEWVSAVMARLFETPEARGMTFHIAPDKPVSSGAVIQYCGEYFRSVGVEFCGHSSAEPVVDRQQDEDQWMFERMCKENMETYAPYERTDNLFDLTNLKKFAADIPCPEIDRTVVHRYIDFGNEDRWGKRRMECIEPPVMAEEFFSGVAAQNARPSASSPDHSDANVVVGLDLTGPGGAQLTLTLRRSGLAGIERGLPNDQHHTLRLSLEAFTCAVTSTAGDAEVLLNAAESAGVPEPEDLVELLLSCLQTEAERRPVQTA